MSELDTNSLFPNDAEPFGTVPQSSAPFGNFPQPSESFRTVPNVSESFRTVPQRAEHSENHTLTVREAARLFEAAGVARTERSIVNWCQPNRMGVARLDCYFDPNERKYFLTLQSVELAIAEEQAKANKEPTTPTTEAPAAVPNPSERGEPATEKDSVSESADSTTVVELQKEITDLKITNRAKDYFIDQLKSEREAFASERQNYVEKLMSFTRTVGQLETQLRQLNAPRDEEENPPAASEAKIVESN